MASPDPPQPPPPNPPPAPVPDPADIAGAEPLPPPKFQEGPVQLTKGLVLGYQWKILRKLGEGGCGAVYLVESTIDKKKAALKAESNFVEGGSVLKLEVDVLSKLRGKKYVCEFIHAGRKEHYQYIVMSLLGPSIADLVKDLGTTTSVSTMLRIGVHVLHGLKQIHDAGFVHRDVKPANMALGHRDGTTNENIIYVLDFGLSRNFTQRDKHGKLDIRRPRRSALFRGTTRYCSANAHLRHDQSRADDLWSLLYVLVELRGELPWAKLTDREQLAAAKKKAQPRILFGECPGQLREIEKYLQTLTYWRQPDYTFIYDSLMIALQDGGYKFSDPWDWQLKKMREQERMQTTLGKAHMGMPMPDAQKLKTKLQSKKSINEMMVDEKIPEADKAIFEKIILPDPHPFDRVDFEKNVLGF